MDFFKILSELQAYSLINWLRIPSNRRQAKEDEILLILHDLDSNAVAIKGSNVFPITFSLIAQVRNYRIYANFLT